MKLPPRTPDTMSDAIALSSPSGRMSKRGRKAAERRLAADLFGDCGSLKGEAKQPDPRETKLRQIQRLRDLAQRGMSVSKFTREADRLEAELKVTK